MSLEIPLSKEDAQLEIASSLEKSFLYRKNAIGIFEENKNMIQGMIRSKMNLD